MHGHAGGDFCKDKARFGRNGGWIQGCFQTPSSNGLGLHRSLVHCSTKAQSARVTMRYVMVKDV